MPKYTDPETGKTISSDTPLNQQELEEAFGIVKMKPQPLTSPQGETSLYQDVPKWWEIVKDVGGGVGSVAGGIGGAALGTGILPGIGTKSGAIAGSGLGYATTNVGLNLAEKALGFSRKGQETPLLEQPVYPKAIAMDIGIGAGLEGLSIVSGPALKAFFRTLPFGYAKAVTPQAEKVMKIAAEEGVDLPAPSITGSAGQSMIYQTLSYLPTSAKTIQKDVLKTMKGYEELGEKLISKTGATVDRYTMGEAVKEGAKTRFDALRMIGNKLYDVAKNKASGTPVTYENFQRIGAEILEDKEFKILPQDMQNIIKTIIRETTEKVPAQQSTIITAQGVPAWTTPAKLLQKPSSFEAADDLRKALGKKSGYEGPFADSMDRFYRMLREGLDQDMSSAATKAGSQAEYAYNKARGFQEKYIFGTHKGLTENYKHAAGEKLSRMNPEEVMNYVKSYTGLNEVRRAIPKKEFQTLKQGILTDLMEQSTKEITSIEGPINIIDAYALEKAMDRITRQSGPKYWSTLLDPAEREAIDRLILIGKAARLPEKLAANPSGTGRAIFMGSLLTGGGAGYYTGKDLPSAMAGAATFLLVPAMTAKFITSKAGVDFMTKGWKMPLPVKGITRSAEIGGIEYLKSIGVLPDYYNEQKNIKDKAQLP